MLSLENVDLIIIDCINIPQAIHTLSLCTREIKFGNVFLFCHEDLPDTDIYKIIKIDEISSIESYSDFCLKLNNYTNNEFVLLIQNDGFIINPELWDDNFLNYDYIGAPWNLTLVPGHKIGNGGFSLRSKKFLQYSSEFKTTNGVPEDNFLCIHNYNKAIDFGIQFAPEKLASKFAHEYKNHYVWSFKPENHFGFHGKENVDEVMKFILKKNDLTLLV